MDPSVPQSKLVLAQSLQSLKDLKKIIDQYEAQDAALEKREEALTYQLKELAARRAAVKDALTLAQASHDTMERSTETLRALLSPMRDLPNELLTSIFGIAIEIEYAEVHANAKNWSNVVSILKVPVTLSSVCRRWRDMFQRSGSLWHHLHLQFCDKVSEEHAISQSKKCAAHWWDKAPAKVRHLFLEVYTDENFPVLRSMLDSSLTSTGMKFDSISITIGGDSASTGWDVGVICADEVSIFQGSEAEGFDHYIPLLLSAKKVLLTGISRLGGARPWTLLTHLSLWPLADEPTLVFGSVELMALLSAAPRLEKLELLFESEDMDHRETMQQSQAVVEHRTLATVHTHLNLFNPNGGLLGVQLVAPALRRLELFGGWEHHTGESPFATWNQPSELALPDIGANETQFFLEVLYRLPNLTTLEVGKNSGDLFQRLIGTYVPATYQAFEVLLPKLRRLWFEESDISGATLTSFIRCRLELADGSPGKPEAIEAVTIFECPSISPREWSVINDLLKEGRESNARIRESRMATEA